MNFSASLGKYVGQATRKKKRFQGPGGHGMLRWFGFRVRGVDYWMCPIMNGAALGVNLNNLPIRERVYKDHLGIF
jgi:hypothetical protein